MARRQTLRNGRGQAVVGPRLAGRASLAQLTGAWRRRQSLTCLFYFLPQHRLAPVFTSWLSTPAFGLAAITPRSTSAMPAQPPSTATMSMFFSLPAAFNALWAPAAAGSLMLYKRL